MLKGVLFDLDDTLLDWSDFDDDWSSMERDHLRGVFDYISTEIQPLDDPDAYYAEFGSRLRAAWMSARDTMRAPNLSAVLVDTAAAFGVPPEAVDPQRCLEAYRWGVIPGTRIFPEVPQTLTLLRDYGIKIGIVTNAHQPMSLRDVEIQQHGLYNFFPDCRISAADVGYLKPHPLIFQTALRRLGTKPEETVFVGDNLAADIAGAQGAGLRAILRHVDRHRYPLDDGTITPDAAITRLDEVPGILDVWYPGWRDS